jgi:signal transduction histidine kinase
MLPTRWRDALSVALAGLVVIASAAVWLADRVATVRWLRSSGDRTTIGWVADASPDRLFTSAAGLLVGVAVLAGLLWWLTLGRPGTAARILAAPFAAATAMPLLWAPLTAAGGPLALLLPAPAWMLAVLLFADAIVSLIGDHRPRRAAAAVAWAVAGLYVVLWFGFLAGLPQGIPGLAGSHLSTAAWWFLFAAPLVATLVPALVFARGRSSSDVRPDPDDLGTAWLFLAACTPWLVAVPGGQGPEDQWLSMVVAPVCIAVLVLVRAVGRRIAQARLQRDLVVTVTEAERARLAAELHDVALQELTLLVRRLDASGQAEAAEMARSVAERLRELCGELHLPILDELGAGPALDWLVGQVAGATGEEIRLERSDPVRPPASVELAVFRVAQEAISNAVKHGGPPVVVRYTTTPTGATLAVDDAGPATESGPEWNLGRSVAPRPGHYGLATMQQRAEQIGALLSIRAWPAGGTRVALEWRAP